MKIVALTLLPTFHRRYIYTTLFLFLGIYLCLITASLPFTAYASDPIGSRSACSAGQVAVIDSTSGLVCKSLAAVYGSGTGVKVCPANEYLAGFDTGTGADADDGIFRCQPELVGSSGGSITVPSCGDNQYIKDIQGGVPVCLSFPSGGSSDFSSIGKCSAGEYLAGFDSSGDKVCRVFGAVNGVCDNSVRNRCTSGTFAAVTDTSEYYKWRCAGTNGGGSEDCQKAKPASPPPTAVNGVCDNSRFYGCTTGTANDEAFPDHEETWGLFAGKDYVINWRCDGSGGGDDSGVCTTDAPIKCTEWNPGADSECVGVKVQQSRECWTYQPGISRRQAARARDTGYAYTEWTENRNIVKGTRSGSDC